MPDHGRRIGARLDGTDACPGDDRGPRVDGGPSEGVGHRAHAADRHAPLAGAVADQVVEEAAVLHQRRLVHRGEGADQGIGRDDAPDGVVNEALLDRPPEGLGHDVAPGAGVDQVADLPLEGERTHQGRSDRLGEVAHFGVELLPGVVVPVRPGQVGEGLAGGPSFGPLDQESAGSPVSEVGRVGGRGPRRKTEVEVEIGHQCLRHEADQVGVSRELRRHPGERRHRDRSAAGMAEPLEDGDRESCPRQVGSRDQSVVPAADDGDVVAVLTCAHPRNVAVPARET